MKFLIDHNIGGHAELLLGTLAHQGWLPLFPIQFIKFSDIGLDVDSDDRTVWLTAQSNHLILLTANRNMDGENSLEDIIRKENCVDSLPVITIANPDRLLTEQAYRDRCIDQILEILLDLENLKGVGRLFIP